MKDELQFLEQLQPLLDKAMAGSLAALNHLIAFCLPHLNAHARRHIGPGMREKGASDLAQETCTKAACKLHTFKGQTALKFWRWLKRIQRNQLVDWARRASLPEQPMNVNDASSSALSPFIDPRSTPKTAVIEAERREAAQEAIGRLPQHYQDVLRLRLGGKITFQEIAEQLGLGSADTVRRYFDRGLEQLTESLRKFDGSS